MVTPVLITEVTTDPLGRGYSGMTDQQVVDDMLLVNRPGPASWDELRAYFLLEVKGGSNLYGRLAFGARQEIGAINPLGDTVVFTLAHISACATMLAILDPPGDFNLDLADSRFDAILNTLAAGEGCKVIAPGDKTALQALSLDRRTRASELGVGNVNAGDIMAARAA